MAFPEREEAARWKKELSGRRPSCGGVQGIAEGGETGQADISAEIVLHVGWEQCVRESGLTISD